PPGVKHDKASLMVPPPGPRPGHPPGCRVCDVRQLRAGSLRRRRIGISGTPGRGSLVCARDLVHSLDGRRNGKPRSASKEEGRKELPEGYSECLGFGEAGLEFS